MEWLPIAIIAAIIAGAVVGFLARRRTEPTDADVRPERRGRAASAADGGGHGRDHDAGDGGSGGDGGGAGDGGGGD
jgi:hypothetical protein